MVFDVAARQLSRELEASTHKALKPRRPIIHHLNDDSSWLLQIPRPETAIRRGSRVYFNIVIDPWFAGGQSDIASWFSLQFHATPSAVQSFAELEDLIRDIERVASAETPVDSDDVARNSVRGGTTGTSSLIDVIAVSHEFTDHCHHDTLLQAHPDVPVFAFKEAATLIQSWRHFRTVIPIGVVGTAEPFDWRTSSIHPFLPEWLGICQLRQTRDRGGLHSALLITFDNGHGIAQSNSGPSPSELGVMDTYRSRHNATVSSKEDELAEALIYTPHGVHFADFEVIPKAVPPISTLVFLHGLHSVRLGTPTGGLTLQLINLGSHNGLKAQRILKAKHWIGTHDEDKESRGLVSWFLQRERLTVDDALQSERKARQHNRKEGGTDSETADFLYSSDDASFVNLRNGESKILS